MRIAVVDLIFYWPPVGGARIDLREMLRRLARDHEVTLFVPRIDSLVPGVRLQGPLARTKFFARGHVDEDLGFRIEPIEIDALHFTPGRLIRLLRERFDAGGYERLLLGDGWYLKPYLVEPFAHLKPIIRLYAYEGLCTKAHGIYYRNGKVCDVDPLGGGLRAVATCVGCTASYLVSYPSPTFLHEYLMARAFSPGYRDVVRRAFAAAERVLVYNEDIARLVRPFARQVDIVPGGVDLEFWSSVPPPPPMPPLRLLVPGRLDDPAKGLHVARAAVAMARDRGVPVELAFTATVPDAKPWERPLGWLSPEALRTALGDCHAVVVPSLWPEPFGMVALEAMAAGRPVIASDVGGLRAAAVKGSGISFPASDCAALSRVIGGLQHDPQRLAAMRQRARDSAVAFGWGSIYSRCYGRYLR